MSMNLPKFAWLTDIHLDCLSIQKRMELYQEVSSCDADNVLITGDIANGIAITTILAEMSEYIHNKYIYFVLGNHDYYHSDTKEVQHRLNKILPLGFNSKINHISRTVVGLPNSIWLFGSDSWADGRYGDYANSDVVLADSQRIYDLFIARKKNKDALLRKMQKLADKAGHQLWCNLENSIQNTYPERDHDLFIVLTHVPPFPEVCKYNRSNTDKEWLPFYSCKATGDVLLKFAKEHPEIKVLVLCGHTHSAAEYQPLPNLLVKCGESEYYHPKINEILEFDINNEPINNK